MSVPCSTFREGDGELTISVRIRGQLSLGRLDVFIELFFPFKLATINEVAQDDQDEDDGDNDDINQDDDSLGVDQRWRV